MGVKSKNLLKGVKVFTAKKQEMEGVWDGLNFLNKNSYNVLLLFQLCVFIIDKNTNFKKMRNE